MKFGHSFSFGPDLPVDVKNSATCISSPAAAVAGAPETAELNFEDVQRDPGILDSRDLSRQTASRLVGVGDSATRRSSGLTGVEWIDRGRILSVFRRIPLLGDLLYALKVLLHAGQNGVVLCEGSNFLGESVCALNHLLGLRMTILAWEIYLGSKWRLRRWWGREVVRGTSLAVVYSEPLIDSMARAAGVSRDKFIALPYKLTHYYPRSEIPIVNFVLSCGDSQRDYPTLFEAVRGTNIPVFVATTRPDNYRIPNIPPNVVLLSSPMPHYAGLMAASRIVVVPIRAGLPRGAGEATVCEAMWYEKPVIAANDTSLMVYIEEGVTGY